MLHASCLLPSFAAGSPDAARLPLPSRIAVDFSRDIQPIFEKSCWRCHGPERPKSGFRLDNREDALKGGANGVAIIPGDSANSPLIHQVARLVPDLAMPPESKGDPLSSEQIALLRAWIDQGAVWPASSATGKPRLTVSPIAGWMNVHGNERKFREHSWRREGWSGGASRFELEQQLDADTRLRIEGGALARQEDHRVTLELRRIDAGFIRGGYRAFRSWHDDAGGYYEPFDLAPPRLGADLHVDTRKAWLDLGLTPPDWPRLTIGYEYQEREGVKSTLQWGGVTVGGTTRSIHPAFKEIDERAHVIKFDLEHELGGARIEDRFRGEFFTMQTRRQNHDFVTFDFGSRYEESHRHFHGANTLFIEKPVRDWWFVSGGYLFSRLSGEGAFRQITFAPSTGAIFAAPSDFTPLVVVRSSSHVFNLNNRFGPWEGLTLVAAAQGDWTRTEGFGDGTVFGFPARFANTYSSDHDKQVIEERLSLRYDRIPRTVLHAEARLRQEATGQFEQDVRADRTDLSYVRDTDATGRLKDFKGGFSVSPWAAVTFSANYRRREDKDRHVHRTDTDASGAPGNGYPAFLLARDERTDEIEARLAARVTRWLRVTLKYELTSTEFSNVTAPAATFPAGSAPGGGILAGNHDAHVYSVNATLTPWTRLHLNSTFSYSDTRQKSGASDGAAIVPFGGGTWSVIHSGTLVVSGKTDFTLTHSFSRADFAQANTAALPLGLNYSLHGVQTGLTRRFKENVRAGVQYLFHRYQERGNGGANDYTAHGAFGTLTMFLP